MISRSNIIWFSVFLFLVVVTAGVFVLRILPVLRESRSLSGQLQSMLAQRRELVSRPEGPPSEALLRAAKEATVIKEEMLSGLEDRIFIDVPRLVPPGIVRPSIYWLDTLRRKRPEISGKAGEAGLSIPPGLGFEDGLPQDEAVPRLLFRLYVTEELIGKAAASRLRSISALNFGEGGKAGGLEDLGIEKAPLRFTVEASLENLFAFIQSLRDASFIYIIDDMKFKVVEMERVEARRPDSRARTRGFEQDMDMEMYMEMMEEPGRRITERFLEVEFAASMYYIPAEGEDVSAPARAPARGEFDFYPGEGQDDPAQRRRMFR